MCSLSYTGLEKYLIVYEFHLDILDLYKTCKIPFISRISSRYIRRVLNIVGIYLIFARQCTVLAFIYWCF